MKYSRLIRSLAVMLVCILVFQMAVPAMATEEAIEDQIGTIEIYSEWTEQVEWDALLHKENGSDYEILLKAEDIAELTGTTLSYRFDELVFARGTYEVRVDPVIRSVLVYLNPPDGKERVLYGGEFQLPYCVVAEDVKNITETYLPLEKLFYLLNVTWFCYDSAVFISSPKETLWNIIGDYLLMAKATPKQAEVVSITVDGKVSDEMKYGLLAIADETDEIFEAGILCAFLSTADFPGSERLQLSAMMDYAAEPYESALAELSYPAAVRAADVMGVEGDGARGELEDRFALWSAIPETAENLLDVFGQFGDIYEFFSKDEALFTQLLSVSMKTDGIPKMGNIGFTVLDFLEYGISILEITANASRSKYWTDGYVEQLDFLAGLEPRLNTMGICYAAGSLREEYDDPAKKLLEDLTEQTIIEAGKAFVDATPFGSALSVYEGIRSGVKLAVPKLSDLMSVGSLHVSACIQYDVSKLAVDYYTQTLETLLRDGLSQDMVDQVHLLGSLMTNASAHCYFNLYDIAKALEAAGEGNARSSETMLERYLENCEIALRLEQASRYDPRLFIFKPYYNLYSEEEGTVRQQIPENYVKFSKPPMGNTNTNLKSCGLAAWDAETGAIYHRSVWYNDQWLFDIIRTDADGTQTVITTSAVSCPCINVMDGWVYYIDGTRDGGEFGAGQLCRVKTDGSSREMIISDDVVIRCWVTDDFLYYCGDTGGIVRCDHDGKNPVQIMSSKDALGLFGVYIDPVEEELFYFHGKSRGVSRYSVDSKGNVVQSQFQPGYVEGMDMVGDTIRIYSHEGDTLETRLFDTAGTMTASYTCTQGDWYLDAVASDDEGNLYAEIFDRTDGAYKIVRLSESGEILGLVTEGKEMNIAGNTLFYLDVGAYGRLRSMSLVKPEVIVTVQVQEEAQEVYHEVAFIPTVYMPGSEEIARGINQSVQTELIAPFSGRKEDLLGTFGDQQGVTEYYSCELYLDTAYASDRILSLGIGYNWVYDWSINGNSGSRGFEEWKYRVFDLTTGEKLQISDLLDPENPAAKSELADRFAQALTDVRNSRGLREDLYEKKHAQEFVNGEWEDIWYFTEYGLEFAFSQGAIASNAVGSIEGRIAYADLEGILDDAFLPQERAGDGTCEIRDAAGTEMEQTYGTKTGKALIVNGKSVDVTVRSEDHEGILFYASRISNAMAWVPQAEQYTIDNR